MFKLLILNLLIAPLLFVSGMNGPARGAVRIALTDERSEISRYIGRGLKLRIIKDSSASQRDFGWIVEITEPPYGLDSRNLIFQNPTGTTADASQVYAWHLGNPEFPNRRKLEIAGYPLTISITLNNPRSEGTQADARFVSGSLKITWEWQKSPGSKFGDKLPLEEGQIANAR